MNNKQKQTNTVPLTDEQKQQIHDATGAGHALICLVESYINGITAQPAPVPLTDERITKALRRAFSLGQTYWQQADSDSYKQNAKSDETRQKFETLIVETLFGWQDAYSLERKYWGGSNG